MLDTNICIFLFKGKYNIDNKIDKVGFSNCFVSEITLAELKYGAENSQNPSKHHQVVNEFLKKVQLLPIFNTLDVYAKEKARLRKKGTPIDDFDLLIGVTGKVNNLIVVTNNLKHFQRIEGLLIEDWTLITPS